MEECLQAYQSRGIRYPELENLELCSCSEKSLEYFHEVGQFVGQMDPHILSEMM